MADTPNPAPAPVDEGKLKQELEPLMQKYAAGTPHPVGSAGRVGLKSGKVSELTAIVPLKPGGADRLRAIIKLVNGDFGGAIKVGTLHDMRFKILDNDTKLLFATTYDGDWDPYIEDFATKIPELMDVIFADVEGWPGIKDPKIKDFIAERQMTADGWFVAYPDQTVNDILRNQKIVEGVGKALDAADAPPAT